LCGQRKVALAELPFSVVILAGGESRRLGQDKASATLGASTLLERTAMNVALLTSDLLIVLQRGQPAPPGLWRIAHDLAGCRGPIAALAGGLLACHHAWALVIACDMPYVSADLVRFLADLRNDCQAVVPTCALGIEPLHAFYHRSALAPMQEAANRGEQRLSLALRGLRCRYVPSEQWLPYDPTQRSFYNINTPQELEQARRWAQATPEKEAACREQVT
ncbi:MAG: molybdenum cofactor guanylyltransferase, partial [Anaerolineales bacterium]